MKNTPIHFTTVKRIIENSGIEDIGKASIRELVRLVSQIEETTGERFVRMEMGVPGLDAVKTGVEAEIEALRKGVASVYPLIEGLPALKEEVSRFIRLFLNVDISPQTCIPTVGSMMGSMAAFMVANRTDRQKEGTLFIDPGFPVQKTQCQLLGHDFKSFDLYNYRGRRLKEKLESFLGSGKISTILFSNPNNPSWMCLNDEELSIIGDLADRYDVIVIEDLAYFAMDFRSDMSVPGQPPYQPTVARYTDNFIMLISSSKIFSYAGQRIGVMAVSEKIYNRKYPDLTRYFSSEHFGHALVYGAIYAMCAGVSNSAQHALAAILKAVNNGEYNFVEVVKEYGVKAGIMKDIFKRNGFRIVYEKDIDLPLADGFYFAVSYPGFTGGELLKELLYYGISAISLEITGSERPDGLRACVSMVEKSQFPDMEKRLKQFRADHPM